ncbi:protein phosphatase inhibitor 2-like [Diorhabda sublineata]|uniref:protein phosphatase inhibitor 2-like n=1 Tax=Diorhabda sublineata TaxID=1163346 RepID=UPI0024E194E3|nr:protein phosphatase inhibitor 2-like [Diorhabda sublineata]
MAENLKRRPKKSILKNSSSFDKQEQQNAKKQKETKWDEMNIIATLHPADKDYGHMKIQEPKTPYNYMEEDTIEELDASELAERIRIARQQTPKVLQPDESDDDSEEELTEEQKKKKKEFELKRKKHYNEFHALQLAKKLLEEDEDDDDDPQEQGTSSKAATGSNPASKKK